jgi:ABC-2 type transport system permease protein
MTGPFRVPRSVWLVIRREYGSRVRARAVVLGTACVAVALLAFVLVEAFALGAPAPLRVGLAGQAISLDQTLPQDMAALGSSVTVVPVDTVAEGVAQVRGGSLDVLVYGARSALHVTVDNQLDPRLRATLNSNVRQQILDAQIAQLGARPDDVLSKVDQAQISVTQLNATDPNLGQRRSVGVIASLLLTWALVMFPVLAARRAAEDARLGTGEALLTVLRPRRLLAGTLGGAGLVGLVHVAVIGVLATILALLFGLTTVPAAVVVALFGGLLWFVLGFGLYGTLATAATASAARPRTQRTVLLAVGGWLVVVFVISAVLLASAPAGTATAVLSVLPPFAPVLLPGRMAAGVAPAWQVLLAIVLALATIGGLAWYAGRVYPRSLLKA